MTTSTGMACVKYLLFIFNLLFMLSGIVILSVGAIVQHSVNKGYAAPFVHGHVVSAPVTLIVAGVAVFVVSFFGCCGAVKENHCMIITFSVLLVIVFLLELAVGITGYVLRTDLGATLEASMRVTMAQYGRDPTTTAAWDTMQTQLKCCGVTGAADWANTTMPASCCRTMPCYADSVFLFGCLPKLTDVIDHAALILGGVAIGIAIVQVVGIILACALAQCIRESKFTYTEHHDMY